MADLLLITDISRLMQVFCRLEETGRIRLRVASSLEAGGEELVREKPAAVFVQTHLSGFSADILLMHLKKQLGRKRTRFFLLAAGAEAGEAGKLYQGVLDTTRDDDNLLAELQRLVDDMVSPKRPRVSTSPTVPDQDSSALREHVSPPFSASSPAAQETPPSGSLPPSPDPMQKPDLPAVAPTPSEPSLEEQGLTYAPRARLKVYSEFSGSFQEAVSTINAADSPPDQLAPNDQAVWNHDAAVEIVEPAEPRSKIGMFLLWFAPVLVAAVVVTLLQHRGSDQKKNVSPAKPAVQVPSPGPAPVNPQPVSTQPTAPPVPVTAAGPADTRMSDKAVISAIAENRKPAQSSGTVGPARPTALPEFIPRYGFDKQYGAANPGWERYKGQVTEFKVLRESGAIRAIQVIDRGGHGVPESFMKGVLKQVAKNPAFVKNSSEKQDGYEIQRGAVSDGIKLVVYRDEQGGTLRAFVMTWQ